MNEHIIKKRKNDDISSMHLNVAAVDVASLLPLLSSVASADSTLTLFSLSFDSPVATFFLPPRPLPPPPPPPPSSSISSFMSSKKVGM
ncbi:hypothetical protein TYRP_015470 [Tyrophagus putrescentiae]|nr:hypothetical protein TYRP_015470 [Tyrophagus putrescentiae]